MPKYFNATGKNWLVFSKNLDSTKSLLSNLKQVTDHEQGCKTNAM
jgi:hypothetical protein